MYPICIPNGARVSLRTQIVVVQQQVNEEVARLLGQRERLPRVLQHAGNGQGLALRRLGEGSCRCRHSSQLQNPVGYARRARGPYGRVVRDKERVGGRCLGAATHTP